METQYNKKIVEPENFISATPSPSPEELQKFYAELYYQAPQSSSYQESYDEMEMDYKRLKCEALLFALRQAGASGGTFLDVGTGEGFLMNAAHRQGLDVTGLDFSSFGVGKFFPELIKQHIAGDLYESLARLETEGKRYKICSSTNVLEHVIDPELFLKSIRGVMESEGLLAITVPNDFSELHQRLLKHEMIDREFWFCPPHHLHYFNATNLPKFFLNRGFEIVDAFSDFPIDLYLLHPGSNYVMDAKNGRAANRARMHHDLMIAKAGLDKYLELYRAMFKVGVGRNITVIVRVK
ncbi:MAG: class I SAM-dependent methyltransferase [Gallionella sp.]